MLFKAAFLAGMMTLCATPGSAQTSGSTYPDHIIRFIVPFPPGGTLDVFVRSISNELGQALGQTVIVENRPGASGLIGAEAVARAPADGHMLMIASNTLITLPAMRDDMPIDVFKDLAPVILMGATPTVITVHPSFAARDYPQFVTATQATKSGVNYNSPGIGSPPHIAGELLARAARLSLVHVPYKGTQPAVADLVAGQIPMMMAPLNAVLPFINEKQLFPIALTDGARTKYLPATPTLHEVGLTNMPAVSSWFGILTTGGTPPAIVKRLNMEISKILGDPKVQERLQAQTFEIKTGSSEDLGKLMLDDAAVNAVIVKEAHITAQ